MRTNYKHYGSEVNTAKKAVRVKNLTKNNSKKPRKLFKAASFAAASALVAIILIVPTTTLAPGVEAFEDQNAAVYMSNAEYSVIVTDNCVPVTTSPVEESTTKAAEEPKETKEVSAEKEENEKPEEKQADVEETEPVEIEEFDESTEQVVECYSHSDSLIYIDNPDLNYSPSCVDLSEYDRAKLERLVMGEAGTMGYEGCALVAQAIRDAMNQSGSSSIDYIIDAYKYYAPTDNEPNQTVKDAVSYIFDENGIAVQHRILCFYTGTSNWHEAQEFIVSCGNVRFFDM